MKDKVLSDLRAGVTPPRRVSRRRLLKGAAGVAGVGIGSGMIKGFPTVWAQNIKDVTLTHVGMSYSTIIDIAREATKELGFKVEMAVTDHPGFLNRVTTQPDSVDIADGELWQALLIVPRGRYQAIEVKKIKLWDKMTPIYTKARRFTDPASPYSLHVRRLLLFYEKQMPYAGQPSDVAEVIAEAVTTKEPRLRWLVGEAAKRLVAGRQRITDEEFIAGTRPMPDDEYLGLMGRRYGLDWL